jgi:hypothetical protein
MGNTECGFRVTQNMENFFEQRIKYGILNGEYSLLNTLEYSAAIYTVSENFTSILENVLQAVVFSQLIQNKLFQCQDLSNQEMVSGLNRAINVNCNLLMAI